MESKRIGIEVKSVASTTVLERATVHESYGLDPSINYGSKIIQQQMNPDEVRLVKSQPQLEQLENCGQICIYTHTAATINKVTSLQNLHQVSSHLLVRST